MDQTSIAMPCRALNSAAKWAVLAALLICFFAFVAVFTIAAAETNVAQPREPKTAAQALWFALMSLIEQTAVLQIHRNLVPDVWSGGKFQKYGCVFGANSFMWYWMWSYDEFRANQMAFTTIAVLLGLSIAFALFGLPSLMMSRGRKISLLNCRRRMCLWIFVYPTACAFFLAVQGRIVVDTSSYVVGSFFAMALFILMSLTVILWDRGIHDEIGYTIGASVGSIYAIQGISTLTEQVQRGINRLDDKNGYLASILLIVFVKALFFILMTFVREILFNIHTATKESKYPPLFAMQLAEDLIISTLYLEQRLSGDFAYSLTFLTFVNLVRDAGWVHEFYCRYLKGLSDNKETTLYMVHIYFQVQQNIVAEIIAAPSILILVLIEKSSNGARAVFTKGLSRSHREELVIVYAIFIAVRIPMAYVGWKFFKYLQHAKINTNPKVSQPRSRLRTLRGLSQWNEKHSNETAAQETPLEDMDAMKDKYIDAKDDKTVLNMEVISNNPDESKREVRLETFLTKELDVYIDKESDVYIDKKTDCLDHISGDTQGILRDGTILNEMMQQGKFSKSTIMYWGRNKVTLAFCAVAAVLSMRYLKSESKLR